MPVEIHVLASVATATMLVAGCGARAGLDLSGDADAAVRDPAPSVADAGIDTGPGDAGSLSDIGDPCDNPTECLSADDVVDVPACIGPGASWPNGHLWEDGYCTAQCTPSSAPGDGEPLARDDCPAGALCVPFDGYPLTFEDGVGVCLLACEEDAECRGSSGGPYSCRRSFGGFDGPMLPVGVCISSHCQSRGCLGSARCDC